MAAAIIALGGNIGDRLFFLKRAALELHSFLKIKLKSSIYETESWGNDAGQPYYNAAILVQTTASAVDVLEKCMEIEQSLGRVRHAGNQNAARNIDLDLIYYENEIMATPLEIPHPRMHLRKFVLQPVSEIAPDWVHPIFNKKNSQLLADCSDRLLVKQLNFVW